MEIERINENTVKFFISYRDIEDRGFEREEIWYNRERSEQLFWQMMDEVNDEEEFSVEGPLWIQVKALPKGLEIVVSKANPEKDLQDIFSFDAEEKVNISLSNNDVDDMEKLKQEFEELNRSISVNDTLILSFASLEELIQFSHYVPQYLDAYINETKLYYLDNQYHLFMKLIDDSEDDDMIHFIYHLGSEFGEEVEIPPAILQEYGQLVIDNQVLHTVRSQFDQ